MARSKPPVLPRPATDDTPPYTDHLRKVHEFATTERLVRSGGVSETLTNADIMLRKQFEAGVSGKTLAQRDYLHQVQLAERARRSYIEARCTAWSQIKAAHRRGLDEAQAAKLPAPRVLPHPDDIVIDRTEGVRILGPIDEEDWKRFDETVRFRDALFLQQAMEDCLNRVRMCDRPTLGAPGVLGYYLNDLLPPSLRLTKFQWIIHVDRLSRLSQRDALKRCRAAWRSVGLTAPRGKRFGTREKLMPMLQATVDLANASLKQKADPQRYEEALYACAKATEEFRASAPRLRPDGAPEPSDQEVLA